MDGIIHTLQEFYLHTKGITYLLMLPALLGFIGFWNFLSKTDEEE